MESNQVQQPADPRDQLALLFESLRALDPPEALKAIQNAYAPYNRDNLTEAEQIIRYGLETFWYFVTGMQELQANGNFAKALEGVSAARDRFQQLGMAALHKEAEALSLYLEALVDVQQLNIQAGIEKMDQVKALLQQAGGLLGNYGPMIEHFEPESLFLAGLFAMNQLDMQQAALLIDRAAEASRQLAKKYHEPDSADYCTLTGLGHYYSALFNLIKGMTDLGLFDLDATATMRDEALNEAAEAVSNLSKGNLFNANILSTLYFAKVISLIAEALEQIERLVRLLMFDGSGGEAPNLKLARERLNSARKVTLKTGQNGTVMLRYLGRLDLQLLNLERMMSYRRINVQPAVSPAAPEGGPAAKDAVRTLIAQGKLEDALRSLLQSSRSSTRINDIILLQSRLSALNQESLLGTITHDELSAERTKIAGSALSLVDMG